MITNRDLDLIARHPAELHLRLRLLPTGPAERAAVVEHVVDDVDDEPLVDA